MTSTNMNRAAQYLVCYGAWLACCALIGVALAQIPGLLIQLALLAQANQWVARAVRQLALPVLGLIWLVAVYWLEWYLRVGAERGQAPRRAMRALVPSIIACVAAFALVWLV